MAMLRGSHAEFGSRGRKQSPGGIHGAGRQGNLVRKSLRVVTGGVLKRLAWETVRIGGCIVCGGGSMCKLLLFVSAGRCLPVDVRGRDLSEAAVEGRDAAKRLCAGLLGVRK
jgi:hypothetical protein